MTLLVVGSVALDSVETPFGSRTRAIGGSASYFSLSASYFSKVRLVATVGHDFPQATLMTLESAGVDLQGLQKSDGKTFHWAGRYGFDLNEAETLATELNVFADFDPILPESYKNSEYVFLANIDPELQLKVLEQVEDPKFVGCDTMNYWINGKKCALLKTLQKIDLLAVNESEARLLSGESNITKAAKIIREMGPRYVVIKRGEYGALLFTPDDIFFAPAYPLEEVFDPTGAGDSFAGGFMGYLAKCDNVEKDVLKRATVYGCVMASFNVESFSFDGMLELDESKIQNRYHLFRKLVGDFSSL